MRSRRQLLSGHGLGSYFKPHRYYFVSVAFEQNTRKWSWRGPLKNGTVFDREITFVTGTLHAIFFFCEINGARKMGTLLTIGNELIGCSADKDARVIARW